MTDSDPASSQILLRCPACGASEPTDPAVLAGSPMIVCRNCGETWPAQPRRTKRRALTARGAAGEDEPGQIDAKRRPLVTYSDGVDKAWAAKMEADVLPETRAPSMIPLTAAAMGAVLFLALFLGAREAAVAALPDLAGLYEAVGLPVNLTGLRLEDVSAERAPSEEGGRLAVRGKIRNASDVAAAVPPLVVTFVDRGTTLGADGFDPPTQLIPAGETAPFVWEFAEAPRQAAEIVIRFRRPAETQPAGIEGAAGRQ